MEYRFNRSIKLISALLISALFVTMLPWREISADANTHGEYSSYPLEITYEQNSTWNNSTQGQYEVTNVSDYDVTSWTLEINYYGDVTVSNIWNVSDITDYDTDEYIYVTSDTTIPAGETYTFGLIADGTDSAPVAPVSVSVAQYVSDEPEATPTPTDTPTPDITSTPEITDTPTPTPEEEEETVIFPYAIFSASTTSDFSFQGWKSSITGDVYSGRDFMYQGSELYMVGYARTVGTVQPSGWITDMTGAEEGITPIDIPDWSESILAKEDLLPAIDSTAFTSQDSIVANGYYYVDGDITIDGTDFIGDAIIVASGNITYNVDSLNAGEENIGRILLYSEEGNITLNGSQIEINGILYAPEGSVSINAYNTTLNGRIVADSFSYSGSILNVTADPSDLELVTDLPEVIVTASSAQVYVGNNAYYTIEIPEDNVYEILYRLNEETVTVDIPEDEELPITYDLDTSTAGTYTLEAYVSLPYGEFTLDSDTIEVITEATDTPTPTPTATTTPTDTPTPTEEPTNTPTPTATVTPTDTPTPTVTVTPTPTEEPTDTPTPTITVTPTVTVTPTTTPTVTDTPTPTEEPTDTPTPTPTETPTPTVPLEEQERYFIYSQGDPTYNYQEYFEPENWTVTECGRVQPTYVASISDMFYYLGFANSEFYREFSPDYSFSMRFTYSNPLCLGNAQTLKLMNGTGKSLDIQIDISKSNGHQWKDAFGQGEWQYGQEPYDSMIGININGDGMVDYAIAEYLPFRQQNTVHDIWLEYDGQDEMLYMYVATYDADGTVTKPETPTLMCNISLEDLFEGDHQLYIAMEMEMGVHTRRTGIYFYGIEFDPYPDIHGKHNDCIEIANPSNGGTYEVGTPIEVYANIDDSQITGTVTFADTSGTVFYSEDITPTGSYQTIAEIPTDDLTPGVYAVTISTTDSDGVTISKSVAITIEPYTVVDAELISVEVTDDDTLEITGTAYTEDENGTYTLYKHITETDLWEEVSQGTSDITEDVLGSIDLDDITEQEITLELIVTVENGKTVSVVETFTIGSATPTPTVTPTDTPVPTSIPIDPDELFCEFTEDTSGMEITYLTDITGTVSGTSFGRYVVTMVPVDYPDSEPQVIGSGSSTGDDIVVANIDPTLLNNGYYKLTITAYNTDDTIWVTDEAIVLVTGNAKIGNFTMSFLDLTLDVTGLPVEVYRTYDSRSKDILGDFGYGWSMSIGGPKISISGNFSDGWTQDTSEGVFGTNNYYWSEAYPHELYVDWGNGHSETFELKLTPESQQIMPITQNISASFVSKDGTSTLEILNCDCTGLIYNQTDGKLYNISLGAFEPTEFLLTRYDGMKFYLSAIDGLTKIEDSNGRYIEITDSGITYSEGGSISFTRDAEGKITAISDGTYTVTYTYDSNGDLVSVTDKNGNDSSFTYDEHYITGITNADGTTVATNEYDADGRLISTTDANGNTITFSHDLDTQTEVVTNRLGYSTVYTYDENGNVLTQTDARGYTTTYTYDSNNNKTSETDPLGYTTTYSYDTNNNLTSATNSEGVTASSAYSAAGQVTSVTLGGITALSLSYDSYGNLTSATDALGNTQTYDYSDDGKLTSLSDSIGDILSITYDSDGNAASVTNSAGMVTTFTYDSYGRAITSSVTYNGTMLTDTYTYDANDNITSMVSADGAVKNYTYDTFGNLTSETDQFGTTSYSYGLYGNLTSAAYPDGTTESFTYDAENQVISSTDRYGKTSAYTYDAVGNLKTITYSNGNTKTYTYDACNRVTSVTSVTGAVTTYGYDSIGRNTSVTDDDGNATTYSYNSQNLISSMTDCNGNTYSFTYDDGGNQTGIDYPNGGSYSATYDVRSRLTSETDAMGGTTYYSYDDSDNLTSVTDAMGNTTSYTYDEAGNLTKVTDPLGNETTYAYDGYGRYLSQTNALGQTASVTYNADGQIASSTDFGGNTIDYTYNSLGMVTAAAINGSEITYTYDSYGNALTIGDNEYTYNSNGQLTSKTDGAGNEVNYTYNSNYLLSSVATTGVSVSYTYDKYGRIQTVTDLEGNVTTYTYDDVGNLETVTYPNGVVTTYGYDSTNLIISIYTENADGDVLQDYIYTRDVNGNITEADEGGRVVSYEYDALGRLTQETVVDSSGTHVTEYSYDANSNRLSKTVDGVVTNYTYNEINQLVQAGNTTYTYDNSGNLVAQSENGVLVASYEYDDFNRLIQVTTIGDTGNTIYEFAYDAAGNRISKTIDGVTTYYITDSSSGYSQVLKAVTGTDEISYVRGFGLISRNDGTDTLYYLTDVTGTVRGLVDEDGNLTDTYVFDSFGNLTESTGTTNDSYGFQGEEQDETGLIYLRARYMDPETGRFLSMDTYGGNLNNPITQNRYLFANSNPMRYRDPSGNFSLVEFEISEAIDSIINTAMMSGFAYIIDARVTDPELKNHNIFGYFAAIGLGALAGGLYIALAASLTGLLILAIVGTIFGVAGIYKGIQDIINGHVGYGIVEIALSIISVFLGWRTYTNAYYAAKTTYTYEVFGTVEGSGFDDVNKEINDFFSASPDGQSGPVVFNAPPGATDVEIQQVIGYVNGCNQALENGYLSETGRVSTQGTLRMAASRAASAERVAAINGGTPYQGVVGHVPDTTWTGKPTPYYWSDMTVKVNSSLGGQANRYPIGYKPTVFIYGGLS